MVETTHLYIKAMEKWCGSQGKVLVQKKKKKAIRKKKKTPANAPPEEPKLTEVSMLIHNQCNVVSLIDPLCASNKF